MIITRCSPVTGKINSLDINVTEEQISAWKSGTLIQTAMPNLSPSEREFIKTGCTPEDWNTLFPREDED